MVPVEVPSEIPLAQVPVEVPAEDNRPNMDRIEFIRPTYENMIELFYRLKNQSVLYLEQVDELADMTDSLEEAIYEHIAWLKEQGYTMGGSYLSYWIDSYNYHENTAKIWAFLELAYASEVEDELL